MHPNRLTRTAHNRASCAPIAFAVVIALGVLVAPAGPVAGPANAAPRPAAAGDVRVSGDDLSQASAVASLVTMINDDRAALGLPPLQIDARLSAIAEERSASMTAAGQLSHVQADGRTMVDLVNADRIRWYALGETIGWNNYPGLDESTNVVNQGWLDSPEHAAILGSTTYNYFGVGLGVTAGGDRYWTAIFLRGPDRTAPWAKMLAPAASSDVTLASRRRARVVTWSWTGDDRPLAELTSGLRSFEVQQRIDGGPWVTVRTSIAARHWSSSVGIGRLVEVRVRARDRAGNVGSWTSPVHFSG